MTPPNYAAIILNARKRFIAASGVYPFYLMLGKEAYDAIQKELIDFWGDAVSAYTFQGKLLWSGMTVIKDEGLPDDEAYLTQSPICKINLK